MEEFNDEAGLALAAHDLKDGSGRVGRRAFFKGDGIVQIVDQKMGRVGRGDVRIAISVSALCGSDRRLYLTGSEVTPGHEFGGTIVEVGHDVLASRIGERGVVYIPVYCGVCNRCRMGLTNGCTQLQDLVGWQRDGGYATYVDVPERCFLRVPDGLDLRIAVLGLDTVGTAAHGLRTALRTQLAPVERVAVLGCGPLGLGVVAVAKDMGLPTPEAFDPVERRLAAAVRLGAERLSSSESENEFDLVVEASGSDEARARAQRLVRPGAALLMLGESVNPYVIPANPRARRTNLFTVRTFYFPVGEAEANWELLGRIGELLLTEISAYATLEELPSVFASFVAGDVIKPMLVNSDYAIPAGA